MNAVGIMDIIPMEFIPLKNDLNTEYRSLRITRCDQLIRGNCISKKGRYKE